LNEPALGRIVIETRIVALPATTGREAIMIVKNILASKRGEVVTIEPTADVTTAIKLLAERRIGAVVILGANHRIVGILSERDIVRALAERGPTALNERVSQVMTRDVKTCTEDDTIEGLGPHDDRKIPPYAGGGAGKEGASSSSSSPRGHRLMRDCEKPFEGSG
jgi:hypothetical protein